MVDYTRAFSAIRKDPAWIRKLALGIAISLIPYVGAIWVLGWQVEYQRNVAWGDDERVPDWSDFSRQALLGLKAYVAVLPYSVVISMLTMPVLIAGFLLAGIAIQLGASGWVGLIAGVGVSQLVLVGMMLLIVPISSSAVLRVALYGGWDSGFQIGEICRLMRKHSSELNRAWGFSVMNTGMVFGLMGLLLGATGLVVALAPGAVEDKAAVVFLLGPILLLGPVILVMPLSMYLGLVNMHLFGSYGRVAYNLAGVGPGGRETARAGDSISVTD